MVVIVTLPETGAVNVLVHVIFDPITKGFAAELHVCVAPAGKPDSTHVGAAALLGPLFVHSPLTVTV